ncbi:MAG: hypothetical protein OXU68_13925 [Bacteroidota bacterium]|nr:hypothetical protein [Bacteroidota bacterium]
MAGLLGMTGVRLRRVLWLAAICWVVPAGHAQVQVLTQENIARSGIARLSDLFALVGGWPATSTEGYHWNASPIGVSQPGVWELMVDSLPIDVRALGHHRLNLLPVNLSEICEVRLYSQPAIISGHAALTGAIHIQTCEPTQDLTVQSTVAAANETGDPGPWRYTPHGGPNVDRSGPVLQSSVAWGSPRLTVRLQAGLDEHHTTDPRIRSRVHTLYRGEKDARIQRRHGQMDLQRAQHRLTLAASRSRDFLYSALLGLELPMDHNISYAQLSGRRRMLAYYLKAGRNQFSTRTNPQDLNADLTHSSTSGQLLRTGMFGNQHLSLGLNGTLVRMRFQPGVKERTVFQGRMFAQWAPQWSALAESMVLGTLRLDGSVPGVTLLATGTLAEPRMNIALALAHRAPWPNYPYWLRQGYHPIRPVAFAEHRPRATSLSADASWQISRERVAMSFSGGVRHHANLPHLGLNARFDSTTTGLRASGEAAYQSGQIGRIEGEIRIQTSRQLRIVLHAAFALPLTLDSAYRSLWKSRLLLQSTTDYSPHPRFSLQVRIRVRGASHWPAYESAARENPFYYTDRLSPAFLADLTLLKRLWHEHLSLSATLRNLVDHDHLHHPAGGRSRLTLHLRLMWHFSTLSGPGSQHSPG